VLFDALEFNVKNNLENVMNFQNRINIIRKTSDISNKYDALWLAKTWRLQLSQKKIIRHTANIFQYYSSSLFILMTFFLNGTWASVNTPANE